MPCPNCSCTSCLPIAGSPISLVEFPLPPSELMTTNRAPADLEVASSRAIINSAERRVSVIQAMLDDLERRKAELLDIVSIHRAAISPLKSFPPELLVEVFAEWATFTNGRFCSETPLLIATKICSRWRRIALDAPQLWTRILEHSPRPIIDSWIIRSKELPLRVRLNLHQFTATSSDPALEALIPYAHRWGQVSFILGPGSNSALAPVRARLQSLRRLKLSFVDVIGAVDFCEVAPRLTEIRLASISPSVVIKLPWEQLRVCTTDKSRAALDVLQRATSLRTCRLDTSTSNHPWPLMPGGTHIRHAELDTFIINWSPVDHSAPSFFASLTLPSLRTLDVRLPNTFNDENDAERLQFASIMFEFLERSAAYLNTLSLTGTPLFPSQLISCLALAPSLISLDIRYDRYSSDVIDDELLYVLKAGLPGSILHRLRSLSLRGRFYFSEEALDAFVTSRRDIDPTDVHRVALLENLTLDCVPPRGWLGSRLPSFHRFVSGGLNITYGWKWALYEEAFAARSPRDYPLRSYPLS